MKTLEIYFKVDSMGVYQEIKLCDNYDHLSKQEVLNYLSIGEFKTSLGIGHKIVHNDNDVAVIIDMEFLNPPKFVDFS